MAEAGISHVIIECTKCLKPKHQCDFFLDKRRKYPASIKQPCRLCTSDKVKAQRSINPDRIRLQERESWKRRFDINGEKKRFSAMGWRLKYKFGITLADFLAMIEKQEGRCAICQIDVKSLTIGKGRREAACVDHDHETGKIRGVLCHSCNTGIGLLGDSIGILEKAIKYLKESSP